MVENEGSNQSPLDIVIIGSGLAGLTCALQLQLAGRRVTVLEAADGVGGRVRTDQHEGFLLDRGFQVFLDSYPEAQRWLDYDALQLKPFLPGALVRTGNQFRLFTDPWRRPQDLLKLVTSPVATLWDKMKVGSLRRRVCRGTVESLYQRPEYSTEEMLRQWGFSSRIVERFFRPFLGGVFLDRDLSTSSRMFEFVFRMFSLGQATLPSKGMQAIPDQLASRLPPNTIRYNARVTGVEPAGVSLEGGEFVPAKTVVVATDAAAAMELLPDQPFPRRFRSVACLYYAAARPPIEEPVLVLNGEGKGPINHLCVPSQVASTYAPAGQALISVTVLESDGIVDQRLESAVRSQLMAWFGSQVADWRHLRTDWIPQALPLQNPPALSPVVKPTGVAPSLFVCGDFLHTASIHGAMESGRLAGEAILRE